MSDDTHAIEVAQLRARNAGLTVENALLRARAEAAEAKCAAFTDTVPTPVDTEAP